MRLDWVCACDAPLACEAVLADADTVLFGAMDATVHAIQLEDGTRRWETRLTRLAIPSLLVVDDGTIVVAVGVKARGRGALVALEPEEGAATWTWNAPGTINGPIAASGPRLLCGSFFHQGGEVTCIERGAKHPLWRRPFGGWVNGVLVHRDVVLVPCMDHELYCLDLATGERRWSFAARGLVFALPLVRDDVLYFGAHDGVFYAVAMDGRLIWRTELADRVSGSAATSDGLIIFGGWDNHVRALDAATGNECWAYDAGAPIVATPLVIDGRLYIGTDGGQLLQLDAANGRRLAVFPEGEPLGREIKTRPLLAGGRLLVGGYDGGAYALRLT